MNNRRLSLLLLPLILFAFTACGGGESHDVVESGTYQGTIQEVNAEETEIYVQIQDGEELELYFTDETTLTQDGEEVPFSTLEKGQSVEVEVEKVGQRLDPITVKILG